MLGDKGYQGILKIHENSATPIKKPLSFSRIFRNNWAIAKTEYKIHHKQ